MLSWTKKHKSQVLPILLMPIFLAFFLFIVCLVFFGSAYNNNTRFYQLGVLCVDLDGGLVGDALLAACQNLADTQSATLPGFTVTAFPNTSTILDVETAVYNGEAWAAMVANTNATLNLNAAIDDRLAGGNSTYNPASAISYIYDEGRNPQTHAILLQINQGILSKLSYSFSELFWSIQLSTRFQNTPGSTLANITSLITQPIYFTLVNLHPANAVGISASSIGLILLVVFAFLFIMARTAFMVPLLWSMKNMWYRFAWIIFVGWWGTFWISLGFTSSVAVYSGVQPGNFMEYWMLNWLQQLVYIEALGLIYPIFKERLGIIFAAFLILNITSAFQNLTIEQEFYRWGYATPFYHAITATRYILFGSFNQLYINIPCLFAMIIFSTVMYPFVLYLNEKVLVPAGLGFGPPPGSDDAKELEEKRAAKNAS